MESNSFAVSFKQPDTTISRVVITANGSLSSPAFVSFRRFLDEFLGAPIEQTTWNAFFVRLLDPGDLSLVCPGVLSVVLLRFEDWDHFKDHAMNPRIEPSYDLVRKKIDELIYAVDCVVARSAARLSICVLPCSPLVAQTPALTAFFAEMIEHLQSSLNPHDSVRVMDLSANQRRNGNSFLPFMGAFWEGWHELD